MNIRKLLEICWRIAENVAALLVGVFFVFCIYIILMIILNPIINQFHF